MARTSFKSMYREWKLHHPGMSEEKRAARVRMCLGKLAYPNFLSAMQAALSLKADKGNSAAKCHPYFCEICNKQHLGNTNSKPVFPRHLGAE